MLSSTNYQNLMIDCWALKLREVWDFAVTSVRPLCHVSSCLSWYCKCGMDFWAKKLWTPMISDMLTSLPPSSHAACLRYCFLSRQKLPCWAAVQSSVLSAASFAVCAADLQSNHPSSAPAILVRSPSMHPFSIVWSVWFCSFPI